ncbi:hypothetical protein ACFOWZ_07220 [Lentzea rhizosphaerae]|uniref:Uncharacterized protein n=1 Tax=Lentzea rhizosphaerae TaxID=2041025 RepID=A0ABV8BM04_9PSEU
MADVLGALSVRIHGQLLVHRQYHRRPVTRATFASVAGARRPIASTVIPEQLLRCGQVANQARTATRCAVEQLEICEMRRVVSAGLGSSDVQVAEFWVFPGVQSSVR